MSRSWTSHAWTAVTLLAFATPLAARNRGEKGSKPIANTIVVVEDTTVGSKQLKAGTYDVKATETTVQFLHNGKVVAASPIAWKDEQSKQKKSSITADRGVLKEVHFPGKVRYAEVEVDSTTMSTGQQ